jgi:putative NIF3 family GTP cyclohydrolase 1 type 2
LLLPSAPVLPHDMPLPTHAAVTRFVASLLPIKENDVPILYHVPRRRRYDAELALIDRIVLSITPTPGVYSLTGHTENRHPPRTLVFLHRPWLLDRRAIRGETLVLASHTSFDEQLTTGWNPPLAMRLGMARENCFCIKGYKGDAERKIGIVGPTSTPRDTILERIQNEFGQTELIHKGQSDEIRVVAIMNAFNEEEVLRVLQMAEEHALLPDASSEARGRHVLYLTGQPRESGMLAAVALGVTVACVGHRSAEEWGIRFMAAAMRNAYPNVVVEEVYEEEEPIIRKPKKEVVAPISTPVEVAQ